MENIERMYEEKNPGYCGEVANIYIANEYMKDHIFELRRMIRIYD